MNRKNDKNSHAALGVGEPQRKKTLKFWMWCKRWLQPAMPTSDSELLKKKNTTSAFRFEKCWSKKERKQTNKQLLIIYNTKTTSSNKAHWQAMRVFIGWSWLHGCGGIKEMDNWFTKAQAFLNGTAKWKTKPFNYFFSTRSHGWIKRTILLSHSSSRMNLEPSGIDNHKL